MPPEIHFAENIKLTPFKIGDLFEKVELKKINPLDTREFRVTDFDKEHTIPAVVAKVGNNGVMYYVNQNDFETTRNKIVIIGDGAVASGLVYYHEKEFTILHNAYAIELKNKNENRHNGLYLACVIQKSIFEFFGYENKPTWNKVKEMPILLPTQNGKPDFDFMENFIKALEKESIKAVESFHTARLKAHKTIIKNHTQSLS